MRHRELVVGAIAAVTLVAACSSGGTSTTSSGARSSTDSAEASRPSPGCSANGKATARSGNETIEVAGARRSYLLQAPTSARPHHPAPLILQFHGYGSDGPRFEQLTQLGARGTAQGSYVVSPTGSNQTWQFAPHGTDAQFVDALVDRVERSACIDLNRISATGFSAGAAFTLFYACARQDRIDAIATVAVEFQLGCKQPMPILAFHGTKDPAVPYVNGAIGASLPGTRVRGTELNMSDWARLNACKPAPATTRIGTEVTRETWSGCTKNADTVLYRIEGGGHAWPGAPPNGAGLTTEQVSATNEILAFFRNHALGR
jgi:polyhydroxybutyrate depolymerase